MITLFCAERESNSDIVMKNRSSQSMILKMMLTLTTTTMINLLKQLLLIPKMKCTIPRMRKWKTWIMTHF